MKHLKIASLVALSLAIGAGSAFAQDKKEKVMPSDAVVKYATDLAAKVSADAKLQEALKAATAEHRKLSYDDVSLIDNQWRLAKSGAEKEKKAKGWLEDNASDKSLDEHTKAGEASIKAVREGAVYDKGIAPPPICNGPTEARFHRLAQRACGITKNCETAAANGFMMAWFSRQRCPRARSGARAFICPPC
jgi:hypothetical protein